jgi:hypothetical protein
MHYNNVTQDAQNSICSCLEYIKTTHYHQNLKYRVQLCQANRIFIKPYQKHQTQKHNLVSGHLKTWYSLLALDLFLPAGLCSHVWLLCSQFGHLSATLTHLSQSQLILFFFLWRKIIIIHYFFKIRQISRQ